MQMDLFAVPAPEAAAPVRLAPVNEWWLSDDVEERRVGVLRSADFWQREHDASGYPNTADGQYAANLRKLASDMEVRPEFYAQKPRTVSDFQWWKAAQA